LAKAGFAPFRNERRTMHNHAPEGYVCPFCLLAAGIENECVDSNRDDVIFRDDAAMAFIASEQKPGNPGHVLVTPVQHYENLYELPLEIATSIHAATRRVALAMKAVYGCEGITLRQNNEPLGSQHVWHYHMHVFPRYAGDGFASSLAALMEADLRRGYARKLKGFLDREGDCHADADRAVAGR
jgi:histidine triad (HIT) family protein